MNEQKFYNLPGTTKTPRAGKLHRFYKQSIDERPICL